MDLVLRAAVVYLLLLIVLRTTGKRSMAQVTMFDFILLLIKRLLESVPVVLVENGRPLEDVMGRERISADDILSAARETQGLESMDQIKWAVLETSGSISIVPTQEG